MLPSLATLDQLEDRTTVENPTVAQAALDDASALIRAHAGKSWVDAEGALTTVPDVIQTICLAAAIRRVNNPMGYASEQISQYSYRYAGGSQSGSVFLTDDEKDTITRSLAAQVWTLITEVPGIKYRPNSGYLPTDPDTGPLLVGDA
jgi:phage gp36-like protein